MNTDYDDGYALGFKHLDRGLPYNLPFGKHITFVRGYKDGYCGEPPDPNKGA